MGVEFLVIAKKHKDFEVGDISSAIRAVGSEYGRMETFPDFLKIRVTGAIKADIEKYNHIWREEYEVVETLDKLSLKPKNMGKSNYIRIGLEKAAKQQQKLQSLLDADPDTFSITSDKIEFSKVQVKSKEEISKVELENICEDVMHCYHKHREYYIDPTFMQTHIDASNADVIEMDLITFESLLISRVD